MTMELSKELQSLTLSPPPDDLEELVEDASGTRLDASTYPDLGRVLVATKSFEVGDMVFRETPVMVWDTTSYWGHTISKFKALPLKHQQGILDMHCSLKEGNAETDQDVSLQYKLMEIMKTNAHDYSIREAKTYSERIHKPESQSALYLWGSKVAHSCLPNLFFSSLTHDGKMELKAIRPVQEGDVLTISYIGDLYESTIHGRRVQLFNQKDFLCRCPRCVDIDYCRQARCTVCSQTIYCQDVGNPSTDNESPVWVCSRCGPCAPAQNSTIMLLESTSMTFLENLKRGPISGETGEVDKLIQFVSKKLSPVHALTLKALRFKQMLSSLNAFIRAQHDHA